MDSDSEPEMFPYDAEFNADHINPFDYQDPLATPTLSWAIAFGSFQQVQTYLNSGKNLNNPDNNGNVPLHVAVMANRMDVVELLLERSDINVNVTNHEGMTPLLLSLLHRPNEDVTMSLLNAGADIHITSKMQESALHFSVRHPLTTISQELIKRGSDINAQDYNNYTPLIQAIHSNNLDVVSLLLYYNADVNICCLHNLTPFMHTLNTFDQHEISQILFYYCDDFSQETIDGWTPLLLAANTRNPLAVEMVKCGADVNHSITAVLTGRTTLLRLSLFYTNSELFKEIWSRIDYKRIGHDNRNFFYTYCKCSNFSNADWLECLYLMLNSTWASDFFAYISPVPQLGHLFDGLIARKVTLEDRLTVLHLFLALGYIVTYDDIFSAYYTYDFSSELEVLLPHCLCFSADRWYHSLKRYPIPVFICGIEKNFSVDYIVSLIKTQLEIETVHYTNERTSLVRILRSFRFFYIPYNEKLFLLHKLHRTGFPPGIDSKILAIPEFPSLTELSRNKVRTCIKACYKENTYYDLQHIIKQLPIPLVVSDILRFKKPLY